MAVLCCSRSAANISGTRCKGECRTCKKHSKATTAWLAAMCGLASGTAAMLAKSVAVCSCKNTDDLVPFFRTASTSDPAVPMFNMVHIAFGSMKVMLASAADDSNSVSDDCVVSTKSDMVMKNKKTKSQVKSHIIICTRRPETIGNKYSTR